MRPVKTGSRKKLDDQVLPSYFSSVRDIKSGKTSHLNGNSLQKKQNFDVIPRTSGFRIFFRTLIFEIFKAEIFVRFLFWFCSGFVLVLFWFCSGFVLVLFWRICDKKFDLLLFEKFLLVNSKYRCYAYLLFGLLSGFGIVNGTAEKYAPGNTDGDDSNLTDYNGFREVVRNFPFLQDSGRTFPDTAVSGRTGSFPIFSDVTVARFYSPAFARGFGGAKLENLI